MELSSVGQVRGLYDSLNMEVGIVILEVERRIIVMLLLMHHLQF